MAEGLIPLSPPLVGVQLRRLGVRSGGVLLVHTAFSTIRPLEGGPAGLIRSLREALGPSGTLVMPSWGDSAEEVFDPTTTPASPDLGVVADTFWRQPGVFRSPHPHAFAAAGPRAGMILADPLPLPPHIPQSPVGRVHELGGQVLLLGVDHDANTTIHLAELLARVPYRSRKRCTVQEDGKPVQIEYEENDHCCIRFRMVGGLLAAAGLESNGPVGYGTGRLFYAQDIVRVTVRKLREDPLFFLHAPDAGCEECDEARAGVVARGPIIDHP